MSNADLLDSIHGSASREANKYLALGADAMFPDGAVRNIQGGLDADKPSSPKRSDIYIAWDTGRVYASFTAGTWTDITCIVGDVRLMAYNYSINEHKYVALDPDTKALMLSGLPSGAVDHGELTGLADDDHPQYYNQARGDARYLKLADHTLAVHDTLGLLKKSGGVMTGLLTLSGAPTADLHASTKKYVDDNIGAGAGGIGIAFIVPGAAIVKAKLAQVLIPGTLTISSVIIYSDDAPTGASLIVDINKNGTTIFTTQGNRPQIAAGGYYDESGTPDITSFAKGDRMSVDIDQIGSTNPGGNDLLVTAILG